MKLDFDSEKPIFQQIAEGIEDAILIGAFPEGSQIPSITEFSVQYTINPATALKGISILVDEGTVYKKRGVGMFVADGAAARLREKRQQSFYRRFVAPMAKEAKRLGLTEEKACVLLKRGFAGEKEEIQ